MEHQPLSVDNLVQKTKDKAPLVLLDVRDAEKFRTGSLQLDGVPLLHLPYAAMQEKNGLSELIANLPPEAQIVTVCTSGNKAEKAAALLREQGLTALSLNGGLTAWRKQNGEK
ncbi:rhodanese-like domain-containing protein [Brevibacillus fluminis]|uniref:Rhodanese-like domain-containing protein n=1 Tax=Brevibacillus fluminis TaxID=511487 RepID=A0A3M8CY24_9BACL|nr:rhodanese-like domain-containing protein [Brevibacillus fluminis]RNB80147.1 rhodanese-like domain-containing protein [Brevibacillus fluminis]